MSIIGTAVRLRVLPALLPVNGRDVEIRGTDTAIEERLAGEPDWNVIVEYSTLTGPILAEAQAAADAAVQQANDAAAGIAASTQAATDAATSAVSASTTAVAAATSADADALQTADDRVQTGLDRTSTASDRLAAEAARDAAQLSAGVFDTTAAGIAGTTNGQYFTVPSSSDVASLFLYKNVSGTATFINAYPSTLSIDSLDPLDIVRYQQPNQVPDDVNKQLSRGLFQNSSVSTIASTYGGRNCWAMTAAGGAGLNGQIVRLPASAFGDEIVIALQVLGITATGTGATQSLSRVYWSQKNASNVEISGTRSPETILTPELGNAGAPAVTTPAVLRFAPMAKHASAAWIDIFIEARNTTASTPRTLYFCDILMATGRNPMFRLGQPATAAANNLLPDTTWESGSVYDAGTVNKAIEDGFTTLSFISGGTPQRSYVLPATGLLAPGRPIQALLEVLTDGSAVVLDVIFRNGVGTELSRLPGALSTSNVNWQALRTAGVVPAGTVNVQYRTNWNMALDPSDTFAKARRPALVAGTAGAVSIDTVVPPTPKVVGAFSATVGAGGEYATLDTALDAAGGAGIFIVPAAGAHNADLSFTPSKVKGHVRIIGQTGFSTTPPIIRVGTKVAGITKTAGRTKIYQATVADLPAINSFQWAYQDGVADPRTLIGSDRRFSQQEGRSNRLMGFAQLIKVPGSPASLSAALSAMDSAGANEPMAWIDSGVLYFTIVGGGNGAAADIYLDALNGLVKADGVTERTCGILELQNIEVRYGGVDGRPFRKMIFSGRVAVHGSRQDCVNYSDLEINGFFEGSSSGSQHEFNGDILNGHGTPTLDDKATCYLHDGRDDGESSHELGRVRMNGKVHIEYMGGAAVAVATCANGEYSGATSYKNQRRGQSWKGAAFFATATPDSNAIRETRAVFTDCIDYESETSFAGFGGAIVHAVGCSAVNSVQQGWINVTGLNCSSSGNGVNKINSTFTTLSPQT